MRAVAKKRFRDKYTDEVYEVGSELNLTPERYAEIRNTDAGLVVAVAEEPERGQQGTADQKHGTEPKTEAEPEPEAESEHEAECSEAEQPDTAGQKPKRNKKQTKKEE